MKQLSKNIIQYFIIGLILGIFSRLFDQYTQILGDVFSHIVVWILIGIEITLHSKNYKQAMVRIFSFCIGMLLSYYVMAIVLHGVYGINYIIGWTIFSLFSPLMAFLVWQIQYRGWIPSILKIGIIVFSLGSTFILFGTFEFYDLLIICFIVYRINSVHIPYLRW